MGGDHGGSLGIRRSQEWLCPGVHVSPSSSHQGLARSGVGSAGSVREVSSPSGAGRSDARESCYRGGQGALITRLLLEYLSGSQEERKGEASDQPQGSQRPLGGTVVQDGDGGQRYFGNLPGRLGHVSRLDRWLLSCPLSSVLSQVVVVDARAGLGPGRPTHSSVVDARRFIDVQDVDAHHQGNCPGSPSVGGPVDAGCRSFGTRRSVTDGIQAGCLIGVPRETQASVREAANQARFERLEAALSRRPVNVDVGVGVRDPSPVRLAASPRGRSPKHRRVDGVDASSGTEMQHSDAEIQTDPESLLSSEGQIYSVASSPESSDSPSPSLVGRRRFLLPCLRVFRRFFMLATWHIKALLRLVSTRIRSHRSSRRRSRRTAKLPKGSRGLGLLSCLRA